MPTGPTVDEGEQVEAVAPPALTPQQVLELQQQLADLKGKVDQMTQLQSQQQPPPGQSRAIQQSTATIGVKTLIKVPELVPKMTFADYKFDVLN